MYIDTVRRSPEGWITMIFSAKAAQTGGVVRRNITWVERQVGRALFENKVRKRGFHLIEAGHQLIVVCNRDPIRLIF